MSSIINSLADALRAGTACDFTSEADRSISSSDFADLVGGRGTVALNEMHPRGLQAKGLHVTGDIDWSFDRWCAVRLDSCEFDNPIAAAGLRVDGELHVTNSILPSLRIYDARIDGDFSLSRCIIGTPTKEDAAWIVNMNSISVNGTLHMGAMTIYGHVNAGGMRISFGAEFSGTTLRSGDTWWGLDLSNSVVKHAINLAAWHVSEDEHRPFSARYISLVESQIGGLIATGAVLHNPERLALNAEGAHITGACTLDNTTIAGTVRFSCATLDAGLSMLNSTVSQPAAGDSVLRADNIIAGADIFLNNLTATGGVSMIGATINGQLGLNGATLTNENATVLTIFQSTISGGIFMGQRQSTSGEAQPFTARGRVTLGEATLASLAADGAHFLNPGKWALDAMGGHMTGTCDLDNTTIEGTVRFTRATLDGGLSMNNAILSQPESGRAVLKVDNLTAGADIFLNNLTATGGVSMIGATINGQLGLNGATLTNEGDADALNVFQSTISGGIFMGQRQSTSGEAQPFTAHGRVALGEATLGSLRADGAHFLNPGKWAFDASGAHITGTCDLDNTTMVGGINLGAAHIRFELGISGSVQGMIDLSVSQIEKSVIFSKLESFGLIRMETTVIGGSLIIQAGCRFLPAVDSAGTEVRPSRPDDIVEDLSDKAAISTDGALDIETCEVDVLKWKRLVVKGRIKFADTDSTAGSSDFTTIGGNMHLDNMEVGEDLNFNFVRFDHVGHLSLNGTKVKKNLQFGFSDNTRPSSIRLRGVTIDELQDEPDFWGLIRDDSGKWIAPADTKVDVDLVDFTYSRFGVPRSHNYSSDGTHSGLGTLENVEERLAWLGLQTRKMERDPERQPSYVPQPYQQLADVYRAMGRDGERRQVLITQQDDLRKFGEMTRATKTWNWFMSTFAAHGYRPLRSFGLTTAIFLLSVVCVWIPKHNDAFVASVAPVTHWKVQGNSVDFTEFPKPSHCTSEYPCLNEWLYTLDAVIPVVDLQQTPYWSFDKSRTVGWFFQILFALLTIFGWISTSIFVIVISGILSKE